MTLPEKKPAMLWLLLVTLTATFTYLGVTPFIVIPYTALTLACLFGWAIKL